MQKPQFTCCLPAPGVSRLLGGISASSCRGRDSLSPCVLRQSWILKWCPLTYQCWSFCCCAGSRGGKKLQDGNRSAPQPSSFFSSQKKLDLCWMYVTSCRRVGPYTIKTFFFFFNHSDYISQEISIHKHTLLACPLHNTGFLLEYCIS